MRKPIVPKEGMVSRYPSGFDLGTVSHPLPPSGKSYFLYDPGYLLVMLEMLVGPA